MKEIIQTDLIMDGVGEEVNEILACYDASDIELVQRVNGGWAIVYRTRVKDD